MVVVNFFLASSAALMAVASAAPGPNGRGKGYMMGKRYAVRSTGDVNTINQVLAGVANDVSKAQQAVTSLQMDFVTQSDNPTSDAVSTLLIGVDSEAENLMNSMAYILNPKNSDYSTVMSKAVLTPFFQQVLSSVNVAMDSTHSLPQNSDLSKSINEMATTLVKMANQATDLDMNKNLIAQITETHDKVIAHDSISNKMRRQTNVLDNVVAGVTTAKQNVDSITNNLVMKGPTPGSEILNSVLVDLNSQIDNVIGSVSSSLTPASMQMTDGNSNALLGPFFQSVSRGSETILGYITKSPLDPLIVLNVKTYESAIGNLASFAGRYNMKPSETMLININHRIHLLYVNSPATISPAAPGAVPATNAKLSRKI